MRPENGKHYLVNYGNSIKQMLCLDIIPPSNGRREHYRFKNIKTGREVLIKSRVKVLSLVP